MTALHADVHCIEDHVLVPREGDVPVARRRIERRVLAIEGRVLIIERRVLVGLHDGRAERPAGPRGVARRTKPVVRACDAAAVEARVASAIGATKQTPLPVSRERTPTRSSCSLSRLTQQRPAVHASVVVLRVAVVEAAEGPLAEARGTIRNESPAGSGR